MKSILGIGFALSLIAVSGTAAARDAPASTGPRAGRAECPAEDASILVTPQRLGAEPESLRTLGWQVAPGASGAVHVDAWFRAAGPRVRKIVSYLPNRLWLTGRCVYTLRETNGLRLAEGERWFQFDPDRPPEAVSIVNSGEMGGRGPVNLVLTRSPRGSRLMICGRRPGSPCSRFIDSRREIYAIRYLQSVDMLRGELGIVERAPGGGLWLVGVSLDPTRLRVESGRQSG